MNLRGVALFCAVFLCMVLVGCETAEKTAPPSRFQGEQPHAFRAAGLLPKETLRSPLYEIADQVRVQEYRFLFTIDSEFGAIPTLSLDLLALRLRELHAIERAQRYAKDAAAVQKIINEARRSGTGLGTGQKDAAGAIHDMPKGFRGLAIGERSHHRAGSKRRREIAVVLGCDPETANPVLAKILDVVSKNGLAARGNGGDLFVRFDWHSVPVSSETKRAVLDLEPNELNNRIDGELQAAGVDASAVRRFRKCVFFTTTQRAQFMDCFRGLDGAANRGELVTRASDSQSKMEALSVIREIWMLSRIHQSKPIDRLEYPGMPHGILRDGSRVIVCSYDYVPDTQELKEAVTQYRIRYPRGQTVFVLAGRASAKARRTLEGSARMHLVEEGGDW